MDLGLILGKLEVVTALGFFDGLGAITEVRLVELVVEERLLGLGQNPGGIAQSRLFEEQAQMNNHVDQGVGDERHGETGSNHTPYQRGANSGDNGTEKTRVEERLKSIRHTKDVVVVLNLDVQGSDTGDNEHANGDANLTSDQERLKVLATEGQLARSLGSGEGGELLLGKVDHGEKSDLQTFHHTHEAHENEKNDDGRNRRHTLPHGGLLVEQCREGNSVGVSKDGGGEEDASPEEEALLVATRGLLAFNRLARNLGKNDLDKVHRMQQTREFNGVGNVGDEEEHESVVDKVKHAVGSVHLASQLSNCDCHKDESKARGEEDAANNVRKSQDGCISNGGGHETADKDDQDNKELTTDNESFHVVSAVGEGGVLQSSRVGISVQGFVNGLKTNEASLSSLHDTQPHNQEPKDEESHNGGNSLFGRSNGLLAEDGSHDKCDGEDQQEHRVQRLEAVACRSKARLLFLCLCSISHLEFRSQRREEKKRVDEMDGNP
jgi:hypothetical protein